MTVYFISEIYLANLYKIFLEEEVKSYNLIQKIKTKAKILSFKAQD
ncbi:hypothetical protein FDUTEX481_06101 [Tolypothrix sp. PCC 7601]|nr:hypothetical protein FDUTEX481_06101 [Tolypothrix sp. PCC 7601]BAY94536.1 hypothetical protein NIES3275_65840 [Microchaete diplosiphon NIES-3275]